jgi:hypothetical protein
VGNEFSISMRDFDASIEQAYRTLFPGDPDKSAELLNWRIRLNPHGRTRFAVASRGADVVGMIALIPTRLRNASGTGRGYQAVDTAVHSSCQGKGLFVRLGRLAQEPAALGGDSLWGFPNANAARGWYGRLRWTNFGPVPLLMRPLRSRFLLSRVHPKLAAIDVPLIPARQSNATVYEDGADLSTDCDALWEKLAHAFGIAVDRSGDWMRWRLLEKPGANYRCVGVKDASGELQAFVAGKVVDKHGARLCYVMEALAAPSNIRELAQLLRTELGRAARQGAEAALAWCPKSAPNYPAYRSAGFIPVSARLRPIEINFGARALVPDSAGAAEVEARWYVSFLDSDTN